MLQFTPEQIQERFEKLPKDLQETVSSAEVRDSIEKLGKKYGLHVDQLGEMVDLVGLIMLGLSPAKDFVKNFSQEAGVKTDIASAIATDINTEVFGKIRSSIQALEAKEGKGTGDEPDQTRFNQTQADQAKLRRNISSVEKAGGFSIEKETTGYGMGNGNDEPDVNYGDKDKILEGIESPEPSVERDHTDPVVDHLLANPAATTVERIVHHTVPPPTNLPEESATIPAPKTEESTVPPSALAQGPKPRGPDLYREPVR